MKSNFPTASEASQQRILRILAQVDAETLVNDEGARWQLSEDLVRHCNFDRGEADRLISMHRRQAAGESLFPAELEYFQAQSELLAAWAKLEEQRDEAIYRVDRFELAKSNRDDCRARLKNHRDLRACLIADLATAKNPDRILYAMKALPHGEARAGDNLHTFSASIVAAQMSVELLGQTIPKLEAELAGFEAQVVESEKELAGATPDAAARTAAGSTSTPAVFRGEQSAARARSVDTAKRPALAPK